MSNIKEFIDEHDLNVEDVIDALDIDPAQFADVPDEPTDFYDGEPSVDELAEDFDAVDILVDDKEDLESEVDSLREEVREAKRPVFADKAERLAELTDKWGEKDDLLDRFDAEDAEEQWGVDDIEEKIELVEDIRGADTTAVTDDESESSTNEPDFETTDSGKFDLRDRTKVQ